MFRRPSQVLLTIVGPISFTVFKSSRKADLCSMGNNCARSEKYSSTSCAERLSDGSVKRSIFSLLRPSRSLSMPWGEIDTFRNPRPTSLSIDTPPALDCCPSRATDCVISKVNVIFDEGPNESEIQNGFKRVLVTAPKKLRVSLSWGGTAPIPSTVCAGDSTVDESPWMAPQKFLWLDVSMAPLGLAEGVLNGPDAPPIDDCPLEDDKMMFSSRRTLSCNVWCSLIESAKATKHLSVQRCSAWNVPVGSGRLLWRWWGVFAPHV